MSTLLSSYNLQWQGKEEFLENDAQLKGLKGLKYVFQPAFINQNLLPGKIYKIAGGCLTGKTTTLKLWMSKLLKNGCSGNDLVYVPMEKLKDTNEVLEVLKNPPDTIRYIFLDNASHFKNCVNLLKLINEHDHISRSIVIFTSNDNSDTFATEFVESTYYLNYLNFRELLLLKYDAHKLESIDLFSEFNDYLLHGGYLPAINQFAVNKKISEAIMKNYCEAMKKEILFHKKQVDYLREVLAVIIKNYCRPATWNMLAQQTTINHPSTIGDYLTRLSCMGITFMQNALIEKTLSAAPKKARKIIFTDPFVYHAIKYFLTGIKENVDTWIKTVLNDSETSAIIVEATVIAHFQRYYPTYYIKSEGDIDLAYIYADRFWPILITWSNEFRVKALKQILKYPNGKILTRTERSGMIEHVRTEPLPRALWKLGK